MHLKVVLYFWHLLLSGLIAGLSLGIIGTLYFEEILQPIPLFMSAFVLSAAWFGWRLKVQLKFRFAMTKIALRAYVPLCAVTVSLLTFGAAELLDSMMVTQLKMPFLLYIAGMIALMHACSRILEWEQMPNREKISYRRSHNRKDDRSKWKRSSESRAFQA